VGERKKSVLLILGPTAVGKTEVGAWVAERVGGEVISADARAVYQGLEIGTARPPGELLARVPHHLIGILDPTESYDAARFRADCERLVGEIHARGRRAVVVGGSTLYVRALTRGLFPGPPAHPRLRARLARLSPEELRGRLQEVDPQAAARIHPHDRVRLIRALEVYLLTGKPMSAHWGREEGFPWPLVKVGLTLPRAELHRRIRARVEAMFAAGLVEEARRLWQAGLPPQAPAAHTIGYQELFSYFRGEISLEEAKERIVRNTKAYARRQLAFFRAEAGVTWLKVGGLSPEEVGKKVLEVWAKSDPTVAQEDVPW
jgi:tRNA dimethylallyltransferase